MWIEVTTMHGNKNSVNTEYMRYFCVTTSHGDANTYISMEAANAASGTSLLVLETYEEIKRMVYPSVPIVAPIAHTEPVLRRIKSGRDDSDNPAS